MARKLRIECEQRTRAGGTLKDLRTGCQAYFNRGEAIVLELALFANGRMVQRADLTNIKVRWRDGATLLSETTVLAASLSATITAQQWRQGVAALAGISFDADATGDLPAGMLTLEVLGTLADGESVFASGTVEAVTVAGISTGTPPTPGPPTSYSEAEVDAMIEAIEAQISQTVNIDLTGDYTIPNPADAADGALIKYRVRQDGTGGHEVSLGTSFRVPNSTGPLQWSIGADLMDRLTAEYCLEDDKWDVVSFIPGYPL